MRLVRTLALVGVIIAAMAATPGLASADLFLQEGPGGNAQVAAPKSPEDMYSNRFNQGKIVGKLDFLSTGSGSGKFSCLYAELSSGPLTEPSSEISLSQDSEEYFFECSFVGIAPGTISMDGCRYGLSDFGPLVDHQAFAAAEIACEPGKAIILKAVGLGCTITIPAQQLSSSSGMQSLQSQTGEKSLLTVVVGSGLKYTTSGWACQFMGVPSGSYSDGSMELDLRTS